MRASNLYLLTNVESLGLERISQYETSLTDRKERLEIKEREYRSLKILVETLMHSGLAISDFDDFYFSYTIPQIGEEFDLLKISDQMVLNIELKSERVSDNKIAKQLKRKRYYLSHLSGEHYNFTFIASEKIFYRLDSAENIEKFSIERIVELLKLFQKAYRGDIDYKFKVADFLVSPINTPDKFLNKEYFLTQQQEKIADEVAKKIHGKCGKTPILEFIEAGAGTGKTLLLYHIAKQFSLDYKVCLIHCTPPNENYNTLQNKWKAIKITIPKYLKNEIEENYDIFVIDETQRIYPTQLSELLEYVCEHNKTCIIAIDPKQTMSKDEKRNNIIEKLQENEYAQRHTLTNKVRTNRELADFIDKIIWLKKTVHTKYFSNVQIAFAQSYEEAKNLIEYYEQKDYHYISYTPSNYVSRPIDVLNNESNTHKVIGQEFDNIVIILDNNFQYKDGVMACRVHPNPNYLYQKLFYQAITRVREKIAIIVVKNEQMFNTILGILRGQENLGED